MAVRVGVPNRDYNRQLDQYEVQIEFGKVQPEANAWSEAVLIGTSESCNLEVTAALFGDELATPKQVKLGLAFQVTESLLAPADQFAVFAATIRYGCRCS